MSDACGVLVRPGCWRVPVLRDRWNIGPVSTGPMFHRAGWGTAGDRRGGGGGGVAGGGGRGGGEGGGGGGGGGGVGGAGGAGVMRAGPGSTGALRQRHRQRERSQIERG